MAYLDDVDTPLTRGCSVVCHPVAIESAFRSTAPGQSWFPFIRFTLFQAEEDMGNRFARLRREDAAVVVTIEHRGKKIKISVESGPPIEPDGNFSDLVRGMDINSQQLVTLRRCRVPRGNDPRYEAFELEARIWQNLRHERILEFLGMGYDKKEFLYVAAPWVENGSLWDYVRLNSTTPRITFLQDVASACLYLHESGYIHGDIKAQNVLVSDRHRGLLCDFRFARSSNKMTEAAVKGIRSLPFQSPEIWEGKSRDDKSDVYAFGIMISQVLSKVEPFRLYTNHAALLDAIVMRDERPPKDPMFTDVEDYTTLWAVAERCWSKDPTQRPSMKDVLSALA